MTQRQFTNDIVVILLFAGVTGAAQAQSHWEQANINGFGVPGTPEVTAVEVFNGYLYAGTYNPIDPGVPYDGAQIFRSLDGVTWQAVTEPGFGLPHDNVPPAILDFVVFNTRLYAGTGRGNACQIWRSLNGTIWAPMNISGFGDQDNIAASCFVIYNSMIYTGVRNEVSGAQIWRSYSGDNNTWSRVAPVTPGTDDASISGFAEFGGALYAAVESESPAQIWRSYGGALGTWVTLVSDGFGDGETLSTGGMAVFGGRLYVGAGNDSAGALLYRTSDGATWEQVIPPGFGDSGNRQVDMVFVYRNALYVGVRNAVTGVEIWRSANGTSWEPVNQDGFGDSNNTGMNKSNSAGVFRNRLYLGTVNVAEGGELWRTGVPVDVDDDGDVDLADFAKFQLCFTGAGGGPVGGSCAGCDVDQDDDVDGQDFNAFVEYMTGPR